MIFACFYRVQTFSDMHATSTLPCTRSIIYMITSISRNLQGQTNVKIITFEYSINYNVVIYQRLWI